MSTINYTDMDITMERLNDEIECIDDLIRGHIRGGVGIKDLQSLARLRANLSLQRSDLQGAMDAAEAVTEVCFVEERHFDVESTLSGQGFVTLETIR